MHDFLHYWHFIDRKTTPAVWDFEKKQTKNGFYTVVALPQIMHTCYKKVAFDVKYSKICFEMYR